MTAIRGTSPFRNGGRGAPNGPNHDDLFVLRVLIVLAKAPVPGKVKTRLSPSRTPEEAAELAAAALLDTLDAAAAVPDCRVVTALDGDLDHARGGPALRAAMAATTTIVQRGTTLGERIDAAHADVAELVPGAATLLIGMDTPQVDPALLEKAFSAPVTLGPSADGGWWALGLHDPRHAALIRDVPTSRDDTGARTAEALCAAGLHVTPLPELRDVDTMADADIVARICPGSRFATTLAALGPAAA